MGRFEVRRSRAVQRRLQDQPDRHPEQIAERIVALKAIGVDLVLGGFLHYLEDVEYFGKRVLPLVRELERRRDAQPA